MDVIKTKRPKWETEETTVLVETVVSFKHLDSKFSTNYSSADRTRFWADTTQKINAVGGNSRTVQQVEKKWRDLKSQTKSKEVKRREEMRKTGGGVAEQINMFALEEKTISPETVLEIGNEATEDRESTSEQPSKVDKEKSGSKNGPKGDSISDFIIEMEEKRFNELTSISSTLSSIDNSL